MKIIVTGGTGWIGSHLIPILLQNPETELIVPVRQGSVPTPYKRAKHITYQDLYHIDHADAIIHLAWGDLDQYQSINHFEHLRSSYELIKYLVIAKGVKNVTVTGTCFEYGNRPGDLHEIHPPNPETAYGIAKDALRRILSKLQGIQLKWLRLFYLYGQDQRPSSLVPKLIEADKLGKEFFHVSGHDKIRDYLPIDRACEMIAKAALQTEVLGAINISSNKPVELRKFIDDRIEEYGLTIKSGILLNETEDLAPKQFWGNNLKYQRIEAL